MTESVRVDGIDMVMIAAGPALIGSTDEDVRRAVDDWKPHLLEPGYIDRFESWIRKEQPRHRVDLAGYSIGKYPVSNGQFRLFLGETGTAPPASIKAGAPGDHPVWDPRLDIAERYIEWLRDRTGRPWRLPSESEWEHAARGGEPRDFPWGDHFDSAMCNTVEAGIATTTPVSRYTHAASPFGVVDLAGNVEEWTSTDYSPYPGGSLIDDDLTASLGSYRVLRGGSFNRGGDLARCARRHGPYPSDAYVYIGFRLALSSNEHDPI